MGALADPGKSGFFLAFFSSRGPTKDGRIKPEICAPGYNIVAAQAGTTNGYVAHSGTSMATPFVAGAAALILHANPALTPAQVLDALASTAVDWGPAAQDSEYGWGRIDVYKAVRKAGSYARNEPPAIPEHKFIRASLAGTGQANEHVATVTDNKYPLSATLIMPTWSNATTPDFDLYVYDPDGREVARSTSATRQETTGINITRTGDYKFKVHAYAGSGEYYLDLSGAFAPAAVPPRISFVRPEEGATVGGTVRVGVSAEAGTVAKVELAVGDRPYSDVTGRKDTDGSYYMDWDTTAETNGTFVLNARLTDGNGAQAMAQRSVTVRNRGHRHKEFHCDIQPGSDLTISLTVEEAGYMDLVLSWAGAADLDMSVVAPDGECVGHPGNSGSPLELRVNTERFGLGTYKVNLHLISGGETEFTLTADAYGGQTFTGLSTARTAGSLELPVAMAGSGRIWLNWLGDADLEVALFGPDGRLAGTIAGPDRPLVAAVSFDQPGRWHLAMAVIRGDAASYTLRAYAPIPGIR